jgi:GntR family transcriptional regulator
LIDKNNPLSLYHQMKQIVLDKINIGEWKPGDKIPTETELCDQYNISRITARRALTELENEGWVERKPAKGTFVKFPGISQELSKFYSFTEEMQRLGHTSSSKQLRMDILTPSDEVRQALKLELKECVYLLKRLRQANGETIIIDHSYLPCKLFPGIERYNFEKCSLYETLKQSYNIVANVAEETIDAVLFTREEAELLEIKKNTPGLLIKRITYSNDIPIEFNYRLVNRDKYKYRVILR